MAVERIAHYEYVKTGEITQRWLDLNDFHYDKIMSEKDNEAYSHRFPVYKYEGITLVEAVITIWPDDDNYIRVNCYDRGTRNLFARFYYWEYGTDDRYMAIINNKIRRRCNELGIEIIPPQIEEETNDEIKTN